MLLAIERLSRSEIMSFRPSFVAGLSLKVIVKVFVSVKAFP